jgi:hypothetical protein
MAELIITLAPGADMKTVAQRLKAHGFQVEQELEALEMLTGQAEASAVALLEAVEGVAAVEASQAIQLPPVGPQGGAEGAG